MIQRNIKKGVREGEGAHARGCMRHALRSEAGYRSPADLSLEAAAAAATDQRQSSRVCKIAIVSPSDSILLLFSRLSPCALAPSSDGRRRAVEGCTATATATAMAASSLLACLLPLALCLSLLTDSSQAVGDIIGNHDR